MHNYNAQQMHVYTHPLSSNKIFQIPILIKNSDHIHTISMLYGPTLTNAENPREIKCPMMHLTSPKFSGQSETSHVD